jgi:hypothetical protein
LSDSDGRRLQFVSDDPGASFRSVARITNACRPRNLLSREREPDRAPVASPNLDRDVDLFHGNDDTISHFPIIGLQQVLTDVSRSTQARPIAENPPIAAVRRILHGIAGPLRI